MNAPAPIDRCHDVPLLRKVRKGRHQFGRHERSIAGKEIIGGGRGGGKRRMNPAQRPRIGDSIRVCTRNARISKSASLTTALTGSPRDRSRLTDRSSSDSPLSVNAHFFIPMRELRPPARTNPHPDSFNSDLPVTDDTSSWLIRPDRDHMIVSVCAGAPSNSARESDLRSSIRSC